MWTKLNIVVRTGIMINLKMHSLYFYNTDCHAPDHQAVKYGTDGVPYQLKMERNVSFSNTKRIRILRNRAWIHPLVMVTDTPSSCGLRISTRFAKVMESISHLHLMVCYVGSRSRHCTDSGSQTEHCTIPPARWSRDMEKSMDFVTIRSS